ncbi:hypothetical protein F2Q70_00018507 [Brassica cretica]|uniref:Uncharacterized protein n=1 Tax=Brassica cretica TaxID=69181 RepID=A0A8S9HZ04_BRACR|nr:hypothetical protein F2Q70_00018507 [Brassica cretica]
MHGLMSYRRFGRVSDRTLVRARSLRSRLAGYRFSCCDFYLIYGNAMGLGQDLGLLSVLRFVR